MENTLFPNDLLQKSIADRLNYFQHVHLLHPKLIDVRNRVIQALRDTNMPLIINVIGPAGVGKSLLYRIIENHVTAATQSELVTNPGKLPTASVVLEVPLDSNFKWGSYRRQVLKSLHEPLIGNKLNLTGMTNHSSADEPRSSTDEALRNSFLLCIKHRSPDVLLIDDAQHLTFGMNGQEINQRVYEFSSLATVVGKTHILFGTYDLWEFGKILEQSEDSTLTIHFSRYRFDISADLQAFIQVVFSFQCHLPLKETPNLIQNIGYLYSGSLGCVGVLHSWLILPPL